MEPETRELWSVEIAQEHNNLLPFSFISENGISSENTLTFEFETADSKIFDYATVIGNSVSNIVNIDSDTYLQKDEEGAIDHKNAFHVEIFAKDPTGIKDYNVRMQEEIYGYETPEYVFNVPKFSWSNVAASDMEYDITSASVWVADSNNQVSRVGYNANAASVTYSSNVTSLPYNIIFETNTDKAYLTTDDYLIKLSVNEYGIASNASSEIYQDTFISNKFEIASLAESNKVWTTNAYLGTVYSRSLNDLSIINQYSGFDAPNKMIWSEYHLCYFISGTNIVWQFKNGVKTAKYSIQGYRIADIAVSPDGYLCMLFYSDTNDIIRIIKPDLYAISISETIKNGKAKYCTYCDQGIFYILVELNSGLYDLASYVFDSKKGLLGVSEDSAEVFETTTTTTPAIPTKKVELDYPNGEEWINVLDSIEITWRSSASASDVIKIELYKGGVSRLLISGSAPNTGIYKWDVPVSIVNGNDYKIKITWLSSVESVDNSDISDKDFVITNVIASTTTTTTQSTLSSIGIGFNTVTRQVVNVLRNGLIGYFDLNDYLFYGLFQTDLSDVTCMATRSNRFKEYSNVSAVRIFVGTDEYLSDKWDSGVVETDKKSMYYGGGDNLEPGETYYVNIQVYDSMHGWSGTQTKELTMPR